MLIKFAEAKGFRVMFRPFKAADGYLKGNKIGLAEELKRDPKKQDYILAHELAHAYLHRDKGDTINSPFHHEYEEQADRAAELVLDLLTYIKNTAPGGNPEAVKSDRIAHDQDDSISCSA